MKTVLVSRFFLLLFCVCFECNALGPLTSKETTYEYKDVRPAAPSDAAVGPRRMDNDKVQYKHEEQIPRKLPFGNASSFPTGIHHWGPFSNEILKRKQRILNPGDRKDLASITSGTSLAEVIKRAGYPDEVDRAWRDPDIRVYNIWRYKQNNTAIDLYLDIKWDIVRRVETSTLGPNNK
jgi:hypothetical protein